MQTVVVILKKYAGVGKANFLLLKVVVICLI